METSLWKRMLTMLRRWRYVLLPAFVALLIAIPFVYRASRLAGLPDIGAPFDTGKFGTIEISDDENAFVEYNQATPTDEPEDVEEAIEKGWPSTPAAGRVARPEERRAWTLRSPRPSLGLRDVPPKFENTSK